MKNNNTKFKKQPFTVTNYEKKFDTFDMMIKEIKTIHPIINEIFNYADNEEATPLSAIVDIVNYAGEHLPDAIERKNLPFAFSISSNKAYIKTDKYISLRWKFTFNKNKTISDVYATISLFSKENNSNENTDTITENDINAAHNLTTAGWKLIKDRDRD